MHRTPYGGVAFLAYVYTTVCEELQRARTTNEKKGGRRKDEDKERAGAKWERENSRKTALREKDENSVDGKNKNCGNRKKMEQGQRVRMTRE